VVAGIEFKFQIQFKDVLLLMQQQQQLLAVTESDRSDLMMLAYKVHLCQRTRG
jgi:hypothetical protein